MGLQFSWRAYDGEIVHADGGYDGVVTLSSVEEAHLNLGLVKVVFLRGEMQDWSRCGLPLGVVCMFHPVELRGGGWCTSCEISDAGGPRLVGFPSGQIFHEITQIWRVCALYACGMRLLLKIRVFSWFCRPCMSWFCQDRSVISVNLVSSSGLLSFSPYNVAFSVPFVAISHC